MKIIAVISDTHGLLRPEVAARLESADVILHAGDLDTQALTDALQSLAQAYIVRGNNDKGWAESLPHSLRFTIEGLRFFMVHNKKDVPRGLSGVDVVVYGHSHQYAVENRDGVLWLNPGGCGRRRFGRELTFCLMRAENGRYQVEKVTVPPGRK